MADIPVVWYHSDEAGAPVLTPTAGSLVAVLDACLVNGFNVRAATITVSGGVAVATSPGHGYEAGKVVLVSGASPAALNGRVRLATVSQDAFTFAAPGVPDGPASGTISVKRAPLGWAKQFAGTGRAIYKRTAPEASAQMIRVDDRGTSPATPRMARVYGVESATAVDTVGPRFPTNTQVASGLYWTKGVDYDPGGRAWSLVGDAAAFYLVLATTPLADYSGDPPRAVHFFGDLVRYNSADAYCAAIMGGEYDPGGASADPSAWRLSISDTNAGAWIARSHLGTGAAQRMGLNGYGANGAPFGLEYPAAPNPVDGSVQFAQPVRAHTASALPAAVARGEMPGLVQTLNSNASGYFADRTVYAGLTGSAREVLVLRAGQGMAAAFDITGPWR